MLKAPRRLMLVDGKLVMIDGSPVEEYLKDRKTPEGVPMTLIESDVLDRILFERNLTMCA